MLFTEAVEGTISRNRIVDIQAFSIFVLFERHELLERQAKMLMLIVYFG